MAYETTGYSSGVTMSATSIRAETIRPAAQSPEVLKALAEASQAYSAAAGAFIQARDNLSDARARWQELRDNFAKVSEQEGV